MRHSLHRRLHPAAANALGLDLHPSPHRTVRYALPPVYFCNILRMYATRRARSSGENACETWRGPMLLLLLTSAAEAVLLCMCIVCVACPWHWRRFASMLAQVSAHSCSHYYFVTVCTPVCCPFPYSDSCCRTAAAVTRDWSCSPPSLSLCLTSRCCPSHWCTCRCHLTSSLLNPTPHPGCSLVGSVEHLVVFPPPLCSWRGQRAFG